LVGVNSQIFFTNAQPPIFAESGGNSLERNDLIKLQYISEVKRQQERLLMCVGTSFRNRGEEAVAFALLAVHQYKGDCVILDGGANVGGYSLHLLSAFRRISKTCRIIAYEPVPPTFKRLNAFASSEEALGLIHPVNAGIGKVPGELTVSYTSVGDVGASFRLNKAGKRANVKITTIDKEVESRITADEELLLVKLDVEGFEWPAIQGMKDVLSSRRTAAIQWERHIKHMPKHSLKLEVDFISNYGYRSYIIGSLHEKFATKENKYNTFLIRIDGEHWSKNIECFNIKRRNVLNIFAVIEGHPFHEEVAAHAMICSDSTYTCRYKYDEICEHEPNLPSAKRYSKNCAESVRRKIGLRAPGSVQLPRSQY
jgi:FkbM family methyltransferase